MNLVQQQNYVLGFRPEQFLPKGSQNGIANVIIFPSELPGWNTSVPTGCCMERWAAPFLTRKSSPASSTVTVDIKPETTYDFTVEDKELKFFDKSTDLRLSARPL